MGLKVGFAERSLSTGTEHAGTAQGCKAHESLPASKSHEKASSFPSKNRTQKTNLPLGLKNIVPSGRFSGY